MDVCPFRRFDDLLLRRAGATVTDVFAQRAGEHVDLLLHDSDRAAERFERHVANVLPVDQHPAAGNVVEARHQRAERRLAAAGRSDQSKSSAGCDPEVQIVKNLPAVVVTEGDVIENDLSCGQPQRMRLRTIDDVRYGFDHFDETFESGISLLKLFREVDEHFDRIEEDADVKCVDRQFAGGEGAAGDEPAAADQDRSVEQPLKEAVPGVETAHDLVIAHLGVEKLQVGVAELAPFQLFVGEGFYHTDSGEGILNPGVNAGDFAAVVQENRVHPAVFADREERHHHRDREQNQRHRHVDEHQNGEGPDDLEQGNDDVFRTVMRQFGDVEEVAHQLGHHLPGVVAVIIGETEPLIVVEEILPHVAFHARPHHVPPGGDEILAAVTDDIQKQQADSDQPEAAEDRLRPFGEEAGGEQLENLGERQVDRTDCQRTEHVTPEESLIGAVIGEEFFQNIHGKRNPVPVLKVELI